MRRTRTSTRTLHAWRALLTGMSVAILCLPAPGRTADEREVLAGPAETNGEGYAEGGIETCMECHDETEKYPVLSILKTTHAMKGDSRTPFASAHGCEVCHGPSAAHVEEETVPPPRRFGRNAPAQEQNAVCLGCHQGGTRVHWKGSTHESRDVACTSCHTIHVEQAVLALDKRPETFARNDQSQTCYECHPQQRAQMHRLSAHPFKEGRIRCSDCHNVHGTPGPSLLVRNTVNNTCYQCHAEKRGPFLWEHQPAREDCLNCHTPHGSNHPALLKARGPWLCQQCHLAQFHPSNAYSGADLPTAQQLVANNCLNCHSEVHGSNHPSGVRLTR